MEQKLLKTEKSTILQKTIKDKEFILYQKPIKNVCLILKAKKRCCICKKKDLKILFLIHIFFISFYLMSIYNFLFMTYRIILSSCQTIKKNLKINNKLLFFIN